MFELSDEAMISTRVHLDPPMILCPVERVLEKD